MMAFGYPNRQNLCGRCDLNNVCPGSDGDVGLIDLANQEVAGLAETAKQAMKLGEVVGGDKIDELIEEVVTGRMDIDLGEPSSHTPTDTAFQNCRKRLGDMTCGHFDGVQYPIDDPAVMLEEYKSYQVDNF